MPYTRYMDEEGMSLEDVALRLADEMDRHGGVCWSEPHTTVTSVMRALASREA